MKLYATLLMFALAVVFVVLKMLGLIAWSWWWLGALILITPLIALDRDWETSIM